MKNELVILKLGGSVITIKNKAFTPNHEAINRLAKEISDSKISSLIIIHGGGSYGHPLAAEYKITEGFRENRQLIGFSKTCNAMQSLNILVIEALINYGLPAISIAPSSCIMTKRGRIERFNIEALTHSLKLGFVPVLYGDAVFDYENGFSILSGDQLASNLAIMFNAKRVIMGVDVDGLYTADPKIDPSAKLIEHISLSELKKLTDKVESSETMDVTGGMMGKIFEMASLAASGIEVIIINALKPGNIYKALRGEKVKGTIIVKG